jgi:hypothetical protein
MDDGMEGRHHPIGELTQILSLANDSLGNIGFRLCR